MLHLKIMRQSVVQGLIFVLRCVIIFGNKLYSALSLIYNGTTKPFGNPTCNEQAFPAEGRKEKMLLVAKKHKLQRLHAIIYVCLSVSLSTYQKPHATTYMYLSPTLALMSHLA